MDIMKVQSSHGHVPVIRTQKANTRAHMITHPKVASGQVSDSVANSMRLFSIICRNI